VSDAERAVLALLMWCGFCRAAPGAACTSQGLHLARYWRAAFDQATTGDVGIALAAPVVPVAVPVGLAAAAGLRAWRIYQVETGLREDSDGAGRVDARQRRRAANRVIGP
jgi:hypothetical protein